MIDETQLLNQPNFLLENLYEVDLPLSRKTGEVVPGPFCFSETQVSASVLPVLSTVLGKITSSLCVTVSPSADWPANTGSASEECFEDEIQKISAIIFCKTTSR